MATLPHPAYTSAASSLEAELKSQEKEISNSVSCMGAMRWEYAQKLRSLQDSYYPRAFPYVNAVHRNSYYQFLLSVEIEWLEKKVVAMEQHKGGFFELRDMAHPKKELFDSLSNELNEAYQRMENVTREELAVLRNYENPPPIVLETIATVMTVRGEPSDKWETCRIMLSETYYFSFFVNKCRKQITQDLPEDRRNALERYLLNPESAPDTVMRASFPAGGMAKWLDCVNRYYHFQQITAVKKQSLDDVKDNLMQLRLKLQEKKAEISGAKAKLSALQQNLSEEEQALRVRYDQTMVPLQEQFVEAHHRFNDLYASPQRRRAEGCTEDF